MADTKNVSVLEEKNRKVVTPFPDEKEREVVSAVFDKFRTTADARNLNFEHFDGLNIIEYIEDSVRRFTTNVDDREGIDDWQARVHDPFTRNKVMAILGKVIQVLPMAEFKARGDEDIRRAQILTNIYEYSEEVDDYEEFMVNMLLEAIVKGTAVGYEGHEKKECKIRNVTGSGDNLKVTEGSKKINRLYGEIVRLEDFYPASVGIRKIKSMPFAFWRTTMPYEQFLQDYAVYKRASDVPMYDASMRSLDVKPYFVDYISNDIESGQVEIIRYYNSDVDEYVIIANGVWLNPIMVDGEKVISPLPFQHKELPFWEIRFEAFDSQFFYGKSLPDKLKSFQDVLNVLTNMLLDQSFLTVFKPILTNGFDSIEDDYLRPGRRTPVDTQGLPIKEAVQELDMSTPTGWHQFILNYTRGVMEEASVDKVQQGSVAGLPDRLPAQAVRTAAEGVSSVLGLFGRFIKYGISRKATLRAKNIMQFWTEPGTPILEQILGQGGNKKVNEAFNTFKFDGATMTDGKRGMKIIEMYSDKKRMPTRNQIRARAAAFEIDTGKKIEIVAIPADYLQSLDFDVKIVQNAKSEMTKDAERALQLEKVRVYKSFFPNLVDDTELMAQTAEKMGDDPTKVMRKEAIPGLGADEKAMQGMVDQGLPTTPTTDIANNMVRGMRGGEQEANDLQALQGGMLS